VQPGKLKPSPFLNGFDLALVLGVVALGFLLASFAVRNSDFWLHLGTGRLITQGGYEFGRAPFTYAGADRTWVNHAWLFDFVNYEMFTRLGGPALVYAKASFLAIACLLLLGIRRSGSSLWIGVLTVGLALLASAPWLVWQPAFMSIIFLSATLFILFRLSGKRYVAIVLALLFGLWANVDGWFILGPAVTALYLLGEWMRLRAQPTSERDPRVVRNLALGLGVGIVACMLNPHHVGVWQIPTELISRNLHQYLGQEAAFQPLFASLVERGTLDFNGSAGGNPVNAFALLLLIVLNGVSIALNGRRSGWGLLFINAALLGLAIVHAPAMPFYAVTAAAVSALFLGEFGLRLREKTFQPGTLQLLAAGRVVLRMGLLTLGLLALAACYPGWLHPLAEQRRLAWQVEPDEALVRAAERMNQWRTAGQLPPEARSLILDPDLAHYCAWYAPTEKTFFDRRLNLHEPEAEAFVKLRRLLYARPGNPPPPTFELDAFLKEHRITHVAFSSKDTREATDTLTKFLRTRQRDARTVPIWSIWDITGRTAIFGWERQSVLNDEQFHDLTFNPLARAFGKEQTPLADGAVVGLPPKRDWADKYMFPESASSADIAEALLLNQYQQYHFDQRQGRQRAISLTQWLMGRVLHFMGADLTGPPPNVLIRMESDFSAVALLAVRAARRGVAVSPAVAESHLALAQAYNSPAWIGLADDVRERVHVASLQRCLTRLSSEQRVLASRPLLQAAGQLYEAHRQGGQLDLTLEDLKASRALFIALPATDKDQREQEYIRSFDKEIQEREQDVREKESLWRNNAERLPPAERAAQAIKLGLVHKALESVRALTFDELDRIPPPQRYGILFERARLHLLAGQIEEMDAFLNATVERYGEELAKPDFADPRLQLVLFKVDASLILGRFSELEKLLIQQGRELQSKLALHAVQAATAGYALNVARQLGHGPGPALVEYLAVLKSPQSDMALAEFVMGMYQLELLHMRLAMTYLEQANNSAAAFQFEQSIKIGERRAQAEIGVWSFENPGRRQSRNTAKMYLDLLRGN